MNKYIDIKNLEVCQLSRELSRIGWKIYEKLDWKQRKIVGDQFITATDSVGANIVEGYRRFHFLERVRFYYNARASLAESSEHWIEVMYERKQVSYEEYKTFKEIAERLSRKLSNFIASTMKAKNEKNTQNN